MLEIIAVVMLCKGNRQRALDRGKSGGSAIAYTLALWLGLEFFGALLAVFLFGVSFTTYVFALGFAVIGGVISWAISKREAKIIPDIPPYLELDESCTVHVFLDKSKYKYDSKFCFTLNGTELGSLEEETMLTAYTKRNRNLITVQDEYSPSQKDSYMFSATSGAAIEIHSIDGVFQKSQAGVSLNNADNNTAAPAGTQDAQSIFCAQCGTQQNTNSIYCTKCGNRLQTS